ncbi:MAG: hypothetical protein ACTHMV_00545 [Chitinophagaceae bacterium]
MPDDIFRGAFVMRFHNHDILTSTYFNTGECNPYPETAKRITAGEPSTDPFIGLFKVIWLEKEDSEVIELQIIKDPHSPRYELKWGPPGKLQYEGHAVLENEILFGYYW